MEGRPSLETHLFALPDLSGSSYRFCSHPFVFIVTTPFDRNQVNFIVSSLVSVDSLGVFVARIDASAHLATWLPPTIIPFAQYAAQLFNRPSRPWTPWVRT